MIGTGGRDIAVADALDHVAGLTILNDVTMRDFQRRTLQWFAGKTWQASTPVGRGSSRRTSSATSPAAT